MNNTEKMVDYSDWNGLFGVSKEVISNIFELEIIPEIDDLDFEKFLQKLSIRSSVLDIRYFFRDLGFYLNQLSLIPEVDDYFSKQSNFSDLYRYYKDIPKIRTKYLEAKDLFIEFELDSDGNYIPVMNDFYRLQLKNLDILEKNINKLLKTFLGVLLSSEDFVMPYELW